MLPALRRRLQDTGLQVVNVEYFPLTAGVELDGCKSALELGASLGAQRVVTHLHDPDRQRGLESLGRFAEIAAGFGLHTGLEFMGLSAGCPNLATALRLVEQLDLPSLAIGIDPLHLARTGGIPDDLADVPRARLGYAQLCDGSTPNPHETFKRTDYVKEAFDRLVPGEGAFPLKRLMQVLPADLPVDVEVPAMRFHGRYEKELEHARRAVHGAHQVIDAC